MLGEDTRDRFLEDFGMITIRQVNRRIRMIL